MTLASRSDQEELFDSGVPRAASRERLEPGEFVLRVFALQEAPALLDAIELVAQGAPLRHMTTAGGWRMLVAMTNCGDVDWLSDRTGYRYDAIDPETNRLNGCLTLPWQRSTRFSACPPWVRRAWACRARSRAFDPGGSGVPMQWLYFDAEDHLDVVRLLGDRQDTAAILAAED